MFDELNKYKKTDHFFLQPSKNIEEVSNAPSDKAGVYIVYALKQGGVDFVYLGYVGEIQKDGSFFVPEGGLKEAINKNGDNLRDRMMKERVEALDIYWYVTHTDKFIDSPKTLAKTLLKKHKDIFGRLPWWN
jgi:hypothetical protein